MKETSKKGKNEVKVGNNQINQNDLMQRMITESMKAVTMVLANTMQDFQTEMREEVMDIKNIITEQEIRHEKQMEQARDLIGLRTKNVASLTKLLKTRLSQLADEEITANSYYYISAKEKLFRKYGVHHWEDFSIHLYNSVHADIDSIDDIRDIHFE